MKYRIYTKINALISIEADYYSEPNGIGMVQFCKKDPFSVLATVNWNNIVLIESEPETLPEPRRKNLK